MKIKMIEKRYAGSHCIHVKKQEITEESREWKLFDGAVLLRQGKNILKGQVLRSLSTPSAFGLELEISYGEEPYVFMPGAVYNGNQMESVRLPYPPFAPLRPDGTGKSGVIADIPHLEKEKDSMIQLLAGDMTTPAVGVYLPDEKKGIFLLGKHKAGGVYTGFSVRKDAENRCLYIGYMTPGVREDRKYFFGNRADGTGFYPHTDCVSTDHGFCPEARERLELPYEIHEIPAERLADFFSYFLDIRQNLEKGKLPISLPYEAGYREVAKKTLEKNYHPEGYLAVGTDHSSKNSCMQTGWVGGGMNNYSFLVEPEEREAYGKGKKTLEFILQNLQTPAGFFYGVYKDGKHYGDGFETQAVDSCLLLRKNADLLYFLLRECMVLEDAGEKIEVSDYRQRLKKCADAFVTLYERYGELGQFIDADTGEMLIEGSASAAIAVAALSLTGTFFREERYWDTAEALGDFYYENYVRRGILNGGPGEICQAPDSESAFGMLEGYVELYQVRPRKKWLQYAEETAAIALSWVVSYDFDFPMHTAAAERHFHSMGSVFANAQNKHGAPGICTLSGRSLLKLYEFSGKKEYLEWLERITRCLVQSVSMPENLVFTLAGVYNPQGYMNERIQLSDWEGWHTIGGFHHEGNWPEVTLMLIWMEVPGIYVTRDGEVFCMDHCRAALDGTELELENPTEYPAVYTILLENRSEICQNRKEMRHILVSPGEKKKICLN